MLDTRAPARLLCPGPFAEADRRSSSRTFNGTGGGFLDEASLAETFATVDANEDGIICFQTIPSSGATPNPASNWQYLYNVVDNSASVPSG